MPAVSKNSPEARIRTIVLDCLDDTQESAAEVISALAGTIFDISESYFGPNVAAAIFEDFARTSGKHD